MAYQIFGNGGGEEMINTGGKKGSSNHRQDTTHATPVFGLGGKNYLENNNTPSTKLPGSGLPTSGTSGGSGSGGNGGTGEYYEQTWNGGYMYPDLSEIFQARLNSYRNSINAQKDAAIKNYESQRAGMAENYQNLRNQSEVERYKAQNKLRNALADRGALDSGAGRTETLAMQTNYGNALNNINLQEQAANEELNNAIANIQAQAAQAIANAEASTYDDIASWLQNITPMAVNTDNYLTNAAGYINDGSLANVGSNVGTGANGQGGYLMPGLAYLQQGGTGLLNDGSDDTLARLLTGALNNPYYSTYNWQQ